MKVRFSAPAQRERLVTARSSPLPNKQENDHHSTRCPGCTPRLGKPLPLTARPTEVGVGLDPDLPIQWQR